MIRQTNKVPFDLKVKACLFLFAQVMLFCLLKVFLFSSHSRKCGGEFAKTTKNTVLTKTKLNSQNGHFFHGS